MVPFQTFDDLFEVGVVAFHRAGIDKVELAVDGGPWTAISQMTINPRTGIAEYWATTTAMWPSMTTPTTASI